MTIVTQKDKRDYYSEQVKPKMPMSRDIGSQLQTKKQILCLLSKCLLSAW